MLTITMTTGPLPQRHLSPGASKCKSESAIKVMMYLYLYLYADLILMIRQFFEVDLPREKTWEFADLHLFHPLFFFNKNR